LTHIISDEIVTELYSGDTYNRGIVINSSNSKNDIISENGLENMSFMCSVQSNYQSRKITYFDNYRIELPINEKETIILKSMLDMDEKNNIDQSLESICEIYDDTLKKAKPVEVYIYNKLITILTIIF